MPPLPCVCVCVCAYANPLILINVSMCCIDRPSSESVFYRGCITTCAQQHLCVCTCSKPYLWGVDSSLLEGAVAGILCAHVAIFAPVAGEVSVDTGQAPAASQNRRKKGWGFHDLCIYFTRDFLCLHPWMSFNGVWVSWSCHSGFQWQATMKNIKKCNCKKENWT